MFVTYPDQNDCKMGFSFRRAFSSNLAGHIEARLLSDAMRTSLITLKRIVQDIVQEPRTTRGDLEPAGTVVMHSATITMQDSSA